jgi:hypothetical protein
MCPFVQDYEIYADETYIHGPIAFALGALICTPRRSEILSRQIRKVRDTFHYEGEVKWKKTSMQKIAFYKALLDVFFDDRYARFSIFSVTKGPDWSAWASTEEERFFKTYYLFLKRIAGPNSRYDVYVDEKSLQKQYRWDKLHFLINRSRRDDWGLRRRNLRSLKPIDSKSSDLLQLSDLLLGSLTSTAGMDAKAKLRQHVLARSADAPPKKLRSENWTPPK